MKAFKVFNLIFISMQLSEMHGTLRVNKMDCKVMKT